VGRLSSPSPEVLGFEDGGGGEERRRTMQIEGGEPEKSVGFFFGKNCFKY